jgi:hypothetical protein
MPADFAGPGLSLLRLTGHLASRQFQHSLDTGPSHHVDELVDGHPALLDPFHHRQQRLAVADQKIGEIPQLRFRISGNRRLNFQLRAGHRRPLFDAQSAGLPHIHARRSRSAFADLHSARSEKSHPAFLSSDPAQTRPAPRFRTAAFGTAGKAFTQRLSASALAGAGLRTERAFRSMAVESYPQYIEPDEPFGVDLGMRRAPSSAPRTPVRETCS